MEPTAITRLADRRVVSSATPPVAASPPASATAPVAATPPPMRLVEPEVEGLCEHDRILTCWYLDAGTGRSEVDLPATLSADFWRYAA